MGLWLGVSSRCSVSRDPDAVLEYLGGRGISRSTIRHAQCAGFLRFVDYAGAPGVAFWNMIPRIICEIAAPGIILYLAFHSAQYRVS